MNTFDEEDTQPLCAVYAAFDTEEQMLAEVGLEQYAQLLSMEDQAYLLSIPGMLESIRESMDTPLDECSDEVGW